jgi:hypothetical protein
MDEFPKLVLLDWQEGDDMIINQKGWFCHNYVELANGNRYQVCFYDLGRLSQHYKTMQTKAILSLSKLL